MEKLENWIEENPWITKSETYKNGKYIKFEEITIPKIHLNNINSPINLDKFLDFWKLYEPYPNEIYLYTNNLTKQDKKEIKDKHLKELIKLGINSFPIKYNNLELLQYLIENNFITNDGALKIAFENGHLKVVEYLVKNGADVNAKDDEALRFASRNGHLDVVNYLVEHGSNIHAADNYALRYAAENGYLDVVKYLVDHGANVNAEDDEALRWASYNGYLDIVKYLVDNGANVNALNDYALRLASKYGHKDIVAFLKEKLGGKA